ncbi:MAG: hypothetical protein E7451_08435 [Ruminococcaceae bacterium]|nr:hypothetical protein [Oscillospiraceae bacterium]
MKEEINGKAVISKDYTVEQFQCDLEMLKYFQDEFIYRHKHFWSILFKIFTLVIVICIMPFASEIAGIKLIDSARAYSLCFPVVAFLLASFGKITLEDEATKMQAVNKAKYTLNRQHMDKRFHYFYYNDKVGTKADSSSKSATEIKKENHRWLAVSLPIKIYMLELLVIIGSALIIIINLIIPS